MTAPHLNAVISLEWFVLSHIFVKTDCVVTCLILYACGSETENTSFQRLTTVVCYLCPYIPPN